MFSDSDSSASSEDEENPYAVKNSSSEDSSDDAIDLTLDQNTPSSSSSSSSSSSTTSTSTTISNDHTQRQHLLSQRKQLQKDLRRLEGAMNAKKRDLSQLDNALLLLPPSNTRDWTNVVLDNKVEAQISSVMQSVWRLPPRFRPFQLEAIRATLSSKSVLLVMPTGGGKSLCFQLPAVIEAENSNKFTVVISPLCSLSEDQVYGLKDKHIEAKVLASYTTKEEVKNIYELMTDPNPSNKKKLTLLYVTPEKIASSKRLQAKLQHCARNNRIGRFVVDECHCVSSWGNDFRPSYRQLNILRTSDFVKDVPMMLLTATATKEVRADIRRVLHFERNNLECFIGSFNRTNLIYRVHSKPESLKHQIAAVSNDINMYHTSSESGIVYTTSRKDTEVLSSGLASLGISSLPYHAGLSDYQRQTAHRRWRSNNVRVICATIAFGMGIDKPDVRFVHHFCLPKSLENYLQESGRAGRDGKEARCVLWYKRKDVFRISPMIHESNSAALSKLYHFVSEFCESSQMCKRRVLADAFGEGESFDPNKHCQKKCDVCLGEAQQVTTIDCTSTALYVLDLLSVLKEEAIKIDVTFAQLVDAARNVGTSWKAIVATANSNKGSISSLKALAKQCPKMSKNEWEELVMAMLLKDGLLFEGFVATSYSFTSYMRVKQSERAKLIQGLRTFSVQKKIQQEDTGTSKKQTSKKKRTAKSKTSKIAKIAVSSSSSSSSGGKKRKRTPKPVVHTISSDDDDFE